MYAQGIFNLFALLPTAMAPRSKEPDEKKTQALEPEKLKFQVQLCVLLVLRYDQDSLLDLSSGSSKFSMSRPSESIL